MVTHSTVTQVPGAPTPSSGLCRYQAHTWYIDMYAGMHLHILNINKKTYWEAQPAGGIAIPEQQTEKTGHPEWYWVTGKASNAGLSMSSLRHVSSEGRKTILPMRTPGQARKGGPGRGRHIVRIYPVTDPSHTEPDLS